MNASDLAERYRETEGRLHYTIKETQKVIENLSSLPDDNGRNIKGLYYNTVLDEKLVDIKKLYVDISDILVDTIVYCDRSNINIDMDSGQFVLNDINRIIGNVERFLTGNYQDTNYDVSPGLEHMALILDR